MAVTPRHTRHKHTHPSYTLSKLRREKEGVKVGDKTSTQFPKTKFFLSILSKHSTRPLPFFSSFQSNLFSPLDPVDKKTANWVLHTRKIEYSPLLCFAFFCFGFFLLVLLCLFLFISSSMTKIVCRSTKYKKKGGAIIKA